jgi:acyl carrier protein
VRPVFAGPSCAARLVAQSQETTENVPEAEKVVVGAIRSLLRRRKGAPAEVTRDSGLYDDLSLDSLDVAELSATLEDDLGRDPYTEGIVPRTVGEVVDFYDK